MRAPELSAVVIAGPIRERVELCLSRLLAQSVLDRMEIVVVDLGGGTGPPAGADHPAVRYTDASHLPSYSLAQAECVRQSCGRIIAFLEDHCYPSPGWAAAVLRAFEDARVSLVSYGFINHNPERYLSRAFFFTEYGRWARPAQRGPIPIPSCNNVAYRKADLAPHFEELDELFDAEFVLHRRILAGNRLAWHEPEAEVAHENWQGFRDGVRANHSHRRMNAARRADANGWGRLRKMVFAGALCGAPLLHLWRLAVSIRKRPALWLRFLEALPVAAGIYTATSIAEMHGVLFGPGRSGRDFRFSELNVARKYGRQ